MKHLSEDHYHAAAAKRGFKWVGTGVPSALEKTEWQCGKGHIWKAPYHDVSRRNGCPYCSGQVPKTAGDYARVAHERGLFWIGTLPSGIHKKTRWQCLHGHQWDQTYSNITHNKSNCPICSDIAHGNRRRFTADHYHALAARRGFKWLGSDVPANIETHTLWECQRGHQWEAVYGNIKKTGCPECAMPLRGESLRHNTDAYHRLAQQRGYTWEGAVIPDNNRTKTAWRCNRGHRFSMTYGNLQQGISCPLCRDYVNGAAVSKPQVALHRLLGGTLNYPVNRYRIDIALIENDIHIAIEYDCWYWHQYAAARDGKRDRILLSQGWRILRIKSGTLLPSVEALDTALTTLRHGAQYQELILNDWEL